MITEYFSNRGHHLLRLFNEFGRIINIQWFSNESSFSNEDGILCEECFAAAHNSKTIMENNKFKCFAPVASNPVQLEQTRVCTKSLLATRLH